MKRTIAAAAIFAFSAGMLYAQSSPLPSFQAATTNNQATFHVGERIPLTLSFTGPTDKSFAIELTEYPFAFEKPEITPTTGWADPHAMDMFNQPGFDITDRTSILSPAGASVSLDLNDLVRFDEPGDYTVILTSYRAGHSQSEKDGISLSDAVPLQSNPIHLTIIPATPEWQAATLERIVGDLSKPHRGDQPPPQSYLNAKRDLRYLGSPAAIGLLIENLAGTHDDWPMDNWADEALKGLSASSRDVAIALMRKQMSDPNYAITQRFMDTFTLLLTPEPELHPARASSEPLPISPGFSQLLSIRYEMPTERERADYEVSKTIARNTLWSQAVDTLDHKTDTARSDSALLLAENPPINPSADAKEHMGRVLRSVFPQLSADAQIELLDDQWGLIRSRELLPFIRTLATQPDSNPDSDGSAPAIVLERWYEFEPENAMREILRQLNNPSPSLSASDLQFLSDKSLPQFEHVWMQGFADPNNDSFENPASLLIRFGSGTASAQMAAIAQAGPCDHTTQAMAYLVRFDPGTAKSLFTDTSPTSDPTDPACRRDQFEAIASYVADPLLTEVALGQLKNPDRTPVDSSVEYLTRYGKDDAAKDSLLDLYLQWSNRWKAKPGDLPDGAPEDQQQDRAFGSILVNALLANQGWIADDALKSTVLSQCTAEDPCFEAHALIAPDFSVEIDRNKSDVIDWRIGHFSCPTLELLEAKLDQFPQGTTFKLQHVETSSQAVQNEAESSLPDLFKKHGMSLTIE